ncbi:unnamed protein product [Rotaria sp. Silwood2]|nr:unnamed protein product [Rotaria sp. Silwood2]
MSSSKDTDEESNLDSVEDGDKVSSDQLKSLFDDYTERYSSESSDENIDALSKLDWSHSLNNLPYLIHRIVSLVYGRLTKLIEEVVLTDDVLPNNKMVCDDEEKDDTNDDGDDADELETSIRDQLYDDIDKKQFRLDQNDSDTTKDTIIQFVTWTILKLILMFMNTNEDCLVYIKYEKNVKEI